MITDTDGVLARLWRRVQLVTSWGRITQSSDAKTAQTLQVKLNNTETQDGLPRIAEFGFSSSPPIGSDVVILFMGGDRSKGVVIGTGHQATRPTGLLSGETKIYDQWGKYIHFTAEGGIIIEARGTPVVVNNTTIVTINASESVQMNTPQLNVSGSITAGGDITDKVRSMAADRVIFNDHTNGSGTSTPTPQQ